MVYPDMAIFHSYVKLPEGTWSFPVQFRCESIQDGDPPDSSIEWMMLEEKLYIYNY